MFRPSNYARAITDFEDGLISMELQPQPNGKTTSEAKADEAPIISAAGLAHLSPWHEETRAGEEGRSDIDIIQRASESKEYCAAASSAAARDTWTECDRSVRFSADPILWRSARSGFR